MDQKELNITIVQSHLHWENPEANRTLFAKKLQEIKETQLIILPEMFTTGFSMNAQSLAEAENGPTLAWMQEMASRKNAAVTGSIIVKERDRYFNRLYFVFPDGSFQQYDKRHTFTLAKEHLTYTAGIEHLIVNYLGWKICLLICYDLRFPVWARNTSNYDALVYVANWPEVRIKAWDTLLQARAIENMSYCIGVNRVGLDGNGYPYNGHSAIYDVLGNLVSTEDYEKEFIETITLSRSHIKSNRNKLKFLDDRDEFNLVRKSH